MGHAIEAILTADLPPGIVDLKSSPVGAFFHIFVAKDLDFEAPCFDKARAAASCFCLAFKPIPKRFESDYLFCLEIASSVIIVFLFMLLFDQPFWRDSARDVTGHFPSQPISNRRFKPEHVCGLHFRYPRRLLPNKAGKHPTWHEQ